MPEQDVTLERVVITCDCGTDFYVPVQLMPKQDRKVGHVTCPDCLAKYDFHLDRGLVSWSYTDTNSEDEE